MLPEPLAIAVGNAYYALECHPEGDLPLGYRHAIWAVLGPKKRSNTYFKNPGWVRRIHLASLAAKRVLPLWEQQFPDEHLPQRILETQETLLKQGKVGMDDYTWQDYAAQVEEFAYIHNDIWNILAVAYSALGTLGVALSDEIFKPNKIKLEFTDYDQDPYYMDTGFWAACAFAGGPIWGGPPWKGSNADKRREFWEWWLDEAVPEAWNAVPS